MSNQPRGGRGLFQNDDRRRGPSTRGASHGGGRGGGRGRGSTPNSATLGSGWTNNNPGSPIFRGDNAHPNPSVEVTQLEDEIIQDRASGLGIEKLSLRDNQLELPARPDYGKEGELLKLWVNYYQIKVLDQKLVLRQYIATIDGAERLSIRCKRRIFAILVEHPPFPIATNYVDKIISPNELPLSGPIKVAYSEEDGGGRNSTTYSVQLRFDKAFHLGDLIADLKSPQPTYNKDEKNEAIQALNMVLAHYPNTNKVQPVGQSKHFQVDGQARELGGGLVGLRGFFHSVRSSTGRLLLNLNVSTGAFYNAGSLLELVKKFNVPQPDGPFALERFLRKLRVRTTHLKTPQVKTISSLAMIQGHLGHPENVMFLWDQAPGGSKQVSVADYFRQVYNKELLSNQIVVNVGTQKRPTFLPAEVCEVIPGQSARQKLSSNQTTAMITLACRAPNINANDIQNQGLRLMGITPAPAANGPTQFHLLPSGNMLAVDGRRLKNPELTYGGGGKVSPPKGYWNLKSLKFTKPSPIAPKKVGFLMIAKSNRSLANKKEADDFMRDLRGALITYGISWPRDFSRYYVASDEESISKTLKKAEKDGIQFLIVFLPNQDAEIYSHLKFHADFENGIHTLCVARIPNGNGAPGHLANLALKINLKLGGVNHRIISDALPQHTMYVGIDVTHPTGTESVPEAPSIAGVVANTNDELGQWPASIHIQGHRVEIVEYLEQMLGERLDAWLNQKNLPERLIVYRDGVSESQYEQVLTDELAAIKKCVERKYSGRTLPKITLIIVGKRHHTRFYPSDRQNADRGGNVLPGTVVDRGCTMERSFDFFMVAHEGIQGTSRPAHYVVLYDENDCTADKLQKLTYYLCYLFGRSARSVSIVPPAYYADIVCERARCYLYDALHRGYPGAPAFDPTKARWLRGVHDKLQKSMFYI
ncbi:hypothetical protein AJ80_01797 [Polytolypa hystricis UAMH7299]|uniref:Piwi domain-containing protein n=1 Tax=Polytolypa hystricis (strain UAMH7299) TaxID=1447883 RepID=A0A2B7YZT9_POLH7|nr:hypothetical protein AJ80_01797 [Polytolypa hystricis UAMH7299]